MTIKKVGEQLLSLFYHPTFFNRLLKLALEDGRSEGESRKVVFIVCGGVRVSLQELEEYDEVVEAALKTDGQRDVVFCNGERWSSE